MLPLTPEQAQIEASFEEQLIEELGPIDFAEKLPETFTNLNPGNGTETLTTVD